MKRKSGDRDPEQEPATSGAPDKDAFKKAVAEVLQSASSMTRTANGLDDRAYGNTCEADRQEVARGIEDAKTVFARLVKFAGGDLREDDLDAANETVESLLEEADLIMNARPAKAARRPTLGQLSASEPAAKR